MEVIQEVSRGSKPLNPIEKDEKKKGTPVGFRPSSVLPRLIAREGFSAKWIRNEAGHIASKLEEGWIIMKPTDNIGTSIRQDYVSEANSLGTEIRYRDLIAMMLPNEVKKAREEYYRNEARESQSQVLRETDSKLKSGGVQTYKPKGMAGRIVIE